MLFPEKWSMLLSICAFAWIVPSPLAFFFHCTSYVLFPKCHLFTQTPQVKWFALLCSLSTSKKDIVLVFSISFRHYLITVSNFLPTTWISWGSHLTHFFFFFFGSRGHYQIPSMGELSFHFIMRNWRIKIESLLI